MPDDPKRDRQNTAPPPDDKRPAAENEPAIPADVQRERPSASTQPEEKQPVTERDKATPPDPQREQQKAAAEPEDKRPVAEHEPLTITVVEPTPSDEPPVQVGRQAPTRVPHGPVPRVERPPVVIPVPRWYWIFIILTAALLYVNYRMVWGERIHYWLVHRLLPPQVVRVEDSIWRHTLGGSKSKESKD
jgi:hypothetical protein